MTRGIRNNNPLNIRRSADRWEGTAATQTDKSFVQFKTMAYGFRAAWKVLESYWKYHHDLCKAFNVRNIIARWAPPTENNTDAYIRTVLGCTGLGGNESFSQPSRGIGYERLELLVRGMAAVECGIPYKEVDVQAIREGFDLAFPGKRWDRQRRLMPKHVADFGISVMPDLRGTTFCAMPADDPLMWDEYQDW